MKTKSASPEDFVGELWACDGDTPDRLMEQASALVVARDESIRDEAFREAAELCVEYAKLMRGAHVNTNTSSSDIKRCILSLISTNETKP
jgi:hypothetical protein